MCVSLNSSQALPMNDQPNTPIRDCAFQPPVPPSSQQDLTPWFPQSGSGNLRNFGWQGFGNRSPAYPNLGGNSSISMGSWNQGSFFNSAMAFPNQGGNFNNSMGFWNQGSFANSSMSFPGQISYGASSMPFPGPGGNANFSMGSWNQGNYANSSMPFPGLGGNANFSMGSWSQGNYANSSMPLPGLGGNANFSMGSWNQGNYANSSMPFPGLGGNANFSMGSWNQGNYFNGSMPFPNLAGSGDSSTASSSQGDSSDSSTALPDQGGSASCQPDVGQGSQWSDNGVNDNKSSINLGDYTMDLDKSDSSITLTDPTTGNQTKVWGDPHVDFDSNTGNPASSMVDGPIHFTLPGNKQVYVKTQPSDSPGASYASDVYIVQGNRGYEIHGLSEKDATPLSVNYRPNGGADLGQQAPQGLKNYIASPNGMIDADTNRPARDSVSA